MLPSVWGFSAAGLFLFTFIDPDTTLDSSRPDAAGFWIRLFSSPNTNAAMSPIEKRFYSVGSATPGAMMLAGQMLSMSITMVLFGLSIGRARITPEYFHCS